MEDPTSPVPQVSSGPHLLLATVRGELEELSVLDAGVVDLSLPTTVPPTRSLAPPGFFEEADRGIQPMDGDDVPWGNQTLFPGPDNTPPRIE